MNGTQDTGNTAPRQDGCKQARYLITGVSGFIGREIARQLREQGYPVRGLLRRPVTDYPMPEGMEVVLGDVMKPESLDALFADTEPGNTVLVHSAAVISVQRRDELCEQVNLVGTENVLAACRKHGVRRLVYLSSVDALLPNEDGTPVSEPERFSPDGLSTSYGRSKAAAAQRVLDAAARGLDCALLLPSAVIGPGDYKRGFLTRMLALSLSGFPRLSIRGGYEFVDVRDVASAAITASKKSGYGDCYILSNEYADVTTVLDTIAVSTGRKPTICTLPLWVMAPVAPLIAAVCRIAGKQPPLTPEAVQLMRLHPAYRHDRAARDLDFAPRPLRETLEDTASFLLEQCRSVKR